MTDRQDPHLPAAVQPEVSGILDNFRLGLSVWTSEMKWLATSLVRRFEISRLAKRLDEEYTRLGRVAEAPRGRMAEKELCLKQIAFLKDEMAALQDELEARRTARLNRLRERGRDEPLDGDTRTAGTTDSKDDDGNDGNTENPS